MKNTIKNLIAVSALLFSGATLAAETAESQAQPPAAQPAAAASAVPQAASAGLTPPATVQEQPLERSTPRKHAKAKGPRSKDLDLRHCLELDTNAAIARCAGE